MNQYTNPDKFKLKPEIILQSSENLDPKDCKIIDGVLYEKVPMKPNGHIYRFYFDIDVYDYVHDAPVKETLDGLFNFVDEMKSGWTL